MSAPTKLVILPRKPSALLRIAVEDCKKVEAMPDRWLHMPAWHSPQEDGKCAVCMAGAVMDRRLGANPKERLYPRDMGENADQVYAINSMRECNLREACEVLDLDLPDDEVIDAFDEAIAAATDGSGHAPWSVYLEQADILEKAGL